MTEDLTLEQLNMEIAFQDLEDACAELRRCAKNLERLFEELKESLNGSQGNHRTL